MVILRWLSLDHRFLVLSDRLSDKNKISYQPTATTYQREGGRCQSINQRQCYRWPNAHRTKPLEEVHQQTLLELWGEDATIRLKVFTHRQPLRGLT